MIVGLSGYARSGKDTVAGLLQGYERRAFADILREGVYRLNPIVFEDVRIQDLIDDYGWEQCKSGFPEVRRLLQVFGTEVGRQLIDDNVWVNAAMKDVSPDDNIIFTDVRFPNEAKAIKAVDGLIWRIDRPGKKPVNTHTSETAMNDWPFDAILTNDGTLEDLQGQVETALLVTKFYSSTVAPSPLVS